MLGLASHPELLRCRAFLFEIGLIYATEALENKISITLSEEARCFGVFGLAEETLVS